MGQHSREVIRRQMRIAHRHLDIAVAQDSLQRTMLPPCII